MVPAEGALRVQVVYGPEGGGVQVVNLQLPPGATAASALQASGLPARFGLSPAEQRIGIWGKVCEAGTVLRDRDRVELYRPLRVDPKEARRQRYRSHREKLAENGAQDAERRAVNGSRKR